MKINMTFGDSADEFPNRTTIVTAEFDPGWEVSDVDALAVADALATTAAVKMALLNPTTAHVLRVETADLTRIVFDHNDV